VTGTRQTSAPLGQEAAPGRDEDRAADVGHADAVLARRARSSGDFLAGLIAAAQLETVGRPDRLPADLFPGTDPEVVQEIWERALAVGLLAGRVSSAPRLYRDQMARVEEAFARAGFEAMGRAVARARRLVAPEGGPRADGESARGHGPDGREPV
jgi:hypothetical protein